jgi:hypothetical protein
MADTQQLDDNDAGDGRGAFATGAGTRQAARDARRVARLGRQIGAFAERHGGAEAQIAYLGRSRARIVLVGEDGTWGDLVAPGHALAVQAAEKAGITVRESFDGELAAKVRTGPYEWRRMAGIQLGR